MFMLSATQSLHIAHNILHTLQFKGRYYTEEELLQRNWCNHCVMHWHNPATHKITYAYSVYEGSCTLLLRTE